MKSIEKMLLGWVLSTLMIGAAALVGGSYWLYRDELGEVFDENLKVVALATAYDYSADTGQSRAVVPPDHVSTGVTLQLPPETPPRETTTIKGRNPMTGATVENLSPANADDFSFDSNAKGVVVVSTAPGTPADGYGFQRGDIVVEIRPTLGGG